MEFGGDNSCGRWIANSDGDTCAHANRYTDSYRHRYSCAHPNTFPDPNSHSYSYIHVYTDAYTSTNPYAYTYQHIWHYFLLLESGPWPSIECDAQLDR